MINIQLPEKVRRVLTTTARIIVLVGGRGSAKSRSAGTIMVAKAQTEGADVLCGREYQNSIEDSVHKLLCGVVRALDIPGANITDKKIKLMGGGGFRYRGFARNPSAVKSAEGFKYGWIEEAQDLSEASIELLLPTIREGNSQIIFTANPQASNDPFSQRFIIPFKRALDKHGFYEDDMHLIIVMNWRDNPWHGELEGQRQYDYDHMPRAKYDHIWEGAFNDSVEDAIIKAEWFDAAVDAHLKLGIKPRGVRVVAHDPSDQGGDAKGLCMRHGSILLDAREHNDLDVNEGCDWATSYAIEHGADLFVWDGDGLGASLKRQVAQAFDGKRIEHEIFKGSERPDRPDAIYEPVEGESHKKRRTNRQTFRNKRAQKCWELRDRYYSTYRAIEKGEYIDPAHMISISSEIEDLDQLRSETCRIPRKHNPNGLIQIMSKIEMMQKFKVASPNMFDATFMSLVVPEPVHIDTNPVDWGNLPPMRRLA